jgi:predicted 3-demethylubiquinone-9 3-methyltransferase (glyoxalase superfamily)
VSKIAPSLWFGGDAGEMVKFYVSLLPDSRIDKIQRNTVDGRPARPAWDDGKHRIGNPD